MRSRDPVGNEPPRAVARPARSGETADAVRDPSEFTRRRATQLGVSIISLRRIVKLNLVMFPCQIQLAQGLLPRDASQWLQYVSQLKFVHPVIVRFFFRV